LTQEAFLLAIGQGSVRVRYVVGKVVKSSQEGIDIWLLCGIIIVEIRHYFTIGTYIADHQGG
jgi:hypothetical protein